MIKQLILLVQLLGLFFYHLIFTGDIAVTQKFPSSIAKWSEALIEITIKKNDIAGFAKIQQNFPEGFTAEPVDTKGATFSFKENKVKFIWMALPAESEFTISHKIKPNETVSGEFTVDGKFSFISESERKNIDIPSATFSVGNELVADEPKTNEPVIIEQPVIEQPTVGETTAPVVASIECKRTIENIEGGKYKVTLNFDKKGIQGFAKTTEQIPNGFTATESDSKGGVFSFKDQEVKILWMAIPKEDKYSLTYTIEANSETANGNYNIKGYFSYLENDVTSKYDIIETSFELNSNQLVADNPIVEKPIVEKPIVEKPIVEKPIVEKPVVEKPVVEKPVVEKPIKEKPVVEKPNNVTSTPNPEKGVSYKVQVGAGHQKVSANYFSAKFNLSDNVSTETHEGWIKYIVGSYNDYKLARDKRNSVRNNVKTAFVTAYNTGKRITVQEALMISNQKWYK